MHQQITISQQRTYFEQIPHYSTRFKGWNTFSLQNFPYQIVPLWHQIITYPHHFFFNFERSYLTICIVLAHAYSHQIQFSNKNVFLPNNSILTSNNNVSWPIFSSLKIIWISLLHLIITYLHQISFPNINILQNQIKTKFCTKLMFFFTKQ